MIVHGACHSADAAENLTVGVQVNPFEAANSFVSVFRQTEYALKRSGHLRKNRTVAEADWDTFAAELGPSFYAHIVATGLAKTLIGEPPRRLLEDLSWSPETAEPLTTVQELMVMGVCRVRNSYIHGEKFTGGPEGQWERDVTLVSEAHAVLNEAIAFSNIEHKQG